MIDSGSGPNLLKRHVLNPQTPINQEEVLILSGITKHQVTTLGLVKVRILGCTTSFHLVDDNFPIPQDGILGSDFLSSQRANINYARNQLECNNIELPLELDNDETIVVPSRTNSSFYIRVANPEIQHGYVPPLNVTKGIFLGNALVSVINGKAHMRIINTTETEVEIKVPILNLTPYEELISVEEDSHLGESDLETMFTISSKSTKSTNSTKSTKSANSTKSTNTPKFEKITESTISTISNELGESIKSIKSTNSTESTMFTIFSQNHVREEDKSRIQNQRIEKIEEILHLDHLNSEEKESIEKLIYENSDCFHVPGEPLGYTPVLQHRIDTTDDQPINTRQYRFPPVHKEEMNRQVKELLDGGIIKPSKSPYNTPVWIVPKKPDSQGNKRWRMVLDFRGLNERTIGDAYPLPNITEILDQLGGAKYFTVLDLASGFHQIKMHARDSYKTAFSTSYGHYEFDRMPFGLKNAPATFQRLMDIVLLGMQGAELFVYLDDIVLYASSLREHEIKFLKLMQRLRKANLKLQPDKCQFLRKEVGYLGHIIGENGVQPDPKKIQAVKDFPIPKNPKNIKQFLGLAGYYRRFIKGFSKLAKPLTNLLKKDTQFQWTETQQRAFEQLRDILCQEPILQFPNFAEPFILTTDASGYAIGGILSQGPIGKDLPIAYTSRVLNNAEKIILLSKRNY